MILGVGIALYGIMTQWYFLALLMAWYVAASYRQWQLFRAFKGSGE